MAKNCPKCGFAMTQGALGYDHIVGWHKIREIPKKIREDERSLRHAEFDAREAIMLYAYLCGNCGYVELFRWG